MIIMPYLFILALTYLPPGYFLLDIISYILHLCSNPPVFCTWHSYSSWLATWHPYSYSPGEFHWLPWILMSRSWSLGRVDSPCCWSDWRSGSVNLQQTVQSSILPGPPVCLSSFFLVNSWVLFSYSYLYGSLYTCMWAPFYTVHLCIFLVFPHLRILVIWYSCNIVITLVITL